MRFKLLFIVSCVVILGTLALSLDYGGAAGVPPWYQTEPVNMGPSFNTAARDAEVTYTANGKTMYFNCADRIPGNGNDICVSYKDNDGNWSIGEPLPYPVNTQYMEVEPLVSINDENTLYIQSNRPGGLGGGDIWITTKVDGEWTAPVNMGAPINSAYTDHCIYFTGPDENTTYFTSTRPGGYGGNDIWTSTRVNGVWQEPVNLGPNVNSSGDDHHSLPSPDGRSLYVNSNRPGGYGGLDIYVTTKDASGTWGPMVNLGSLVNSDKDDRCGAFTPDFKTFVFDSERSGGYGNKDLWSINYQNIRNIK